MRAYALRKAMIFLFLGLLALSGCGRRPPPPVAKTPEATSPSGASHQVSGSTIRLADPQGRWTFEARAERVQAASLDGPYTLEPAECRYEQPGRPPVRMRAARAQVDRSAGRVVLEGDVRLDSATWTLEARRVEYSLDEGKVVASGGRN